MRVIVTGDIAHLEQKGGKLVFVLEPDPATGIMMLKAEEVGGYLGQEVRDQGITFALAGDSQTIAWRLFDKAKTLENQVLARTAGDPGVP